MYDLLITPTLSTSGVGSTPGNNTKNTGVCGAVSLYVSMILKGGYSTYSTPISSYMNIFKALDNLSGLIALNNNNL